MNKMAVLLATDDWDKMRIFQEFLAKHSQAVWRTRGRYTPQYLGQIPYPINLYFFHRNVVRYQATCSGIYHDTAANWPLSDSPPEFRSDKTPFSTFVVLTRLRKIGDVHISNFHKWDNPNEHFQRGLLGLMRVQDLVEA